MNARLSNTDQDGLHEQTERCSAITRRFLETSGRYLDLQIDASRHALNSFCSPFAILDQCIELPCQNIAPTTDNQQHFDQMIEQSWNNWSTASQRTVSAQLQLLSRICQPLSNNSR